MLTFKVNVRGPHDDFNHEEFTAHLYDALKAYGFSDIEVDGFYSRDVFVHDQYIRKAIAHLNDGMHHNELL